MSQQVSTIDQNTSRNSIFINAPAPRVLAAIRFCFQPVFEPGGVSALPSAVPHTLKFHSQKWKDLGTATCLEPHPGKTELRFNPPDPVNRQEAAANEEFIRQECLKEHHRLLGAFRLTEENADQYADALHKSRMKRQHELRCWLLDQLQILGLHEQSDYPNWISSEHKMDKQFDFPIKGSPAQFGVMLQQFISVLQTQPEYIKVNCRVFAQGSKANKSLILPEANPVKIKLTAQQDELSIHAHLVPVSGTLLRVHLHGKDDLWGLWDNIRDELEKLSWFELPLPPVASSPTQPQSTSEAKTNIAKQEPWLLFSKENGDQDLVRFFYGGLSFKEIGLRMGLDEQTVNNRVCGLRKIQGEKIIPRRR